MALDSLPATYAPMSSFSLKKIDRSLLCPYTSDIMRSTIAALATAALLSSTTLAFKHSSPLLVWSSEPYVQCRHGPWYVKERKADEVNRNDALVETAAEVSSGLIDAEAVYETIHTLGCDWETLMVVHVDEVSQDSVIGDEERKARKPSSFVHYVQSMRVGPSLPRDETLCIVALVHR